VARLLAFLGGVPRVGSPASQVLSRSSDSSAPFPPRFGCPSRGRYRPRARSFAPAGGEHTVDGQGSFHRGPRPGSRGGGVRPPRFLGDPCTYAMLSDPGRALGSRPLDPSVLPAHTLTALAPAMRSFSGLNHLAPVLAVYASRPASPPVSRKTRFRLLARLCRAGSLPPAGSLRKVSVADILLTQACPGAPGFGSLIDPVPNPDFVGAPWHLGVLAVSGLLEVTTRETARGEDKRLQISGRSALLHFQQSIKTTEGEY